MILSCNIINIAHHEICKHYCLVFLEGLGQIWVIPCICINIYIIKIQMYGVSVQLGHFLRKMYNICLPFCIILFLTTLLCPLAHINMGVGEKCLVLVCYVFVNFPISNGMVQLIVVTLWWIVELLCFIFIFDMLNIWIPY